MWTLIAISIFWTLKFIETHIFYVTVLKLCNYVPCINYRKFDIGNSMKSILGQNMQIFTKKYRFFSKKWEKVCYCQHNLTSDQFSKLLYAKFLDIYLRNITTKLQVCNFKIVHFYKLWSSKSGVLRYLHLKFVRAM